MWESPFSTQCMELLHAQSSLLRKSGLVTPLYSAKEIVSLLGHQVQACVVELASTVQHFLAPILAAVTLVVVV